MQAAVAFFQLALRLEPRLRADAGNRADVLHGLALVSSHSGPPSPQPCPSRSERAHFAPGDGASCIRNLTLALASEMDDATKAGGGSAPAFVMSNFACVMSAWCALRNDNIRMLQLTISVFAQVTLNPHSLLPRPLICPSQPASPARGEPSNEIPSAFTSRRWHHQDRAAALVQLLRDRQYSRELSAEDRISSPAAAAAVFSDGRRRKCRSSHKHGIVCVCCACVGLKRRFGVNRLSGIWHLMLRWICSICSGRCSCCRQGSRITHSVTKSPIPLL